MGTPGRVMDMIRQEVLKIEHINTLVLDEADEMLNMGFKEDLFSIMEAYPGRKADDAYFLQPCLPMWQN